MLWTEYRPVIKIGPKGALVSHEIRPIHSALSLGQSIPNLLFASNKEKRFSGQDMKSISCKQEKILSKVIYFLSSCIKLELGLQQRHV